MDRFLASSFAGDRLFFPPDTEHHLLNVLRYKKGDRIEAVYRGHLFLSRIEGLDPFYCVVEEEINEESELPAKLYLGFSLLRGGHAELVLQKGTELGVAGFYPFVANRTVASVAKGEEEKKGSRYKKIVAGALEQCGRLQVPEIHKISTFPEVLKVEKTKKYIAYEGKLGSPDTWNEALKDLKKGDEVLVLVGPEGGFSPEEADEAMKAGFVPVSLGKRILRAETASMYLCSLFSAAAETL